MKKYLLLQAVGLLVVFPACHKGNAGAARPIQSNAIVTTVAGDGVGGFMDGNGTAAELFLPMGVAVDTMGNVYIADEGNSCIRKILGVGQVSTFAGNGNMGFRDGSYLNAEFSGLQGLARDAQGSIYVADSYNNCIRKITALGVFTLAGTLNPGYADGSLNTASFNDPGCLTVGAQGIIYVGDGYNNRIRKISPDGTVTTLAGDGLQGYADGPGSTAEFSSLSGLVTDAQGNIYVADQTNHRIRKVTPSGDVSTLAGNGTIGYVDGTASAAEFNYPTSVQIDAQGNLLVTDAGNNRIRKITPAGMVSTLAGNGIRGNVDGPLSGAEFNGPLVEAMDTQGNLYVGDLDNRIREITPGGTVITIAGNGRSGFADGPAPSAEFYNVGGMVTDLNGNIYIGDFGNDRIRKIAPAGTVATYAGSGVPGFVDGSGNSAQFNEPIGVAVDLFGNVYVADAGNNCIRWISPNAQVVTEAGNGSPGFADGHLGNALFDAPFGVAVDAKGNQFVADNVNNRIRMIELNGQVSTAAGTGAAGFVDGPGSSAEFNVPDAVAVDATGNLYVTDVANNCVRKIDPGGVVSTLAGDGHPGLIDGTGKGAEFKQPNGVAVDGKGNVYVADNANNCIRMISAAGVVTTVAGSFTAGYADGVGSAAMFDHPFGIAIDKHGDLYVGDLGNNRIRKIHFP